MSSVDKKSLIELCIQLSNSILNYFLKKQSAKEELKKVLKEKESNFKD